MYLYKKRKICIYFALTGTYLIFLLKIRAGELSIVFIPEAEKKQNQKTINWNMTRMMWICLTTIASMHESYLPSYYHNVWPKHSMKREKKN